MARSADQAAPARRWVAVTPSNTAELPAGCCGIFVTGAGNIACAGSDGVVATFPALVGSIIPIGPTKVMATGTTATGIIAFY